MIRQALLKSFSIFPFTITFVKNPLVLYPVHIVIFLANSVLKSADFEKNLADFFLKRANFFYFAKRADLQTSNAPWLETMSLLIVGTP